VYDLMEGAVLVTEDNNIGDTDHSFNGHSEDITAINAVEDILLDIEISTSQFDQLITARGQI